MSFVESKTILIGTLSIFRAIQSPRHNAGLRQKVSVEFIAFLHVRGSTFAVTSRGDNTSQIASNRSQSPILAKFIHYTSKDRT